jgi:ferrochelatase
MQSSQPIDAVLFIGFGGPEKPEDVWPFLRNVVRGQHVPDQRLEEVARHYEAVGGFSPYNRYTRAQARALQETLAARGLTLPVYMGMRNWHPFLHETLAQMHRDGVRRCVGIILAPHRAQTSWERYQQDVERARTALGGSGPEVLYPPPWHTRPLFLEALAQRVEEATGFSRGAWPAGIPLVFTAHSIPARMPGAETYAAQVYETAAGVAALLAAPDWTVGYQSRSGDPRTPWLEPDVVDRLAELKQRDVQAVVVVPVGFLCDNVEVLYDLDVEAQQAARELGLRMIRVPTVSSHPLFIQMLAELVAQVMEQTAHELAV